VWAVTPFWAILGCFFLYSYIFSFRTSTFFKYSNYPLQLWVVPKWWVLRNKKFIRKKIITEYPFWNTFFYFLKCVSERVFQNGYVLSIIGIGYKRPFLKYNMHATISFWIFHFHKYYWLPILEEKKWTLSFFFDK